MKSFVTRIIVTAALATLTACAAPAAHAPDEVHFALPHWEVPAGAEKLNCVYVTLPVDTDVFVWRFDTEQAPGGHHIAVFETTEDVPDGTTIDCSGPDTMTNWRPILTGLSQSGFSLPDSYAVKVPGKARLVIQSHYVNASSAAIETDDHVGIFFHRSSSGLTLVNASIQTTVDFSVPPGQQKTVSFDCPVQQELKVFTLLGHMHEWGTHLTVNAGAAANPPVVYDVAWEPGYRDHPPAIDPGFDHPIVLEPGDVIRTTCTWMNTESNALQFPDEMCVSLFWFYPADDSLICTRSTASN